MSPMNHKTLTKGRSGHPAGRPLGRPLPKATACFLPVICRRGHTKRAPAAVWILKSPDEAVWRERALPSPLLRDSPHDALSDRLGRPRFNGTPNGRHHWCELFVPYAFACEIGLWAASTDGNPIFNFHINTINPAVRERLNCVTVRQCLIIVLSCVYLRLKSRPF